MSRQLTIVLPVMILSTLGSKETLAAQTTFPSSPPAELAADLREHALDDYFLSTVILTLRQAWRPHPIEELDALADTLVDVTLDVATQNVEGAARHVYRVVAYLLDTAYGDGRTSPYSGAVPRLIELAYRLPASVEPWNSTNLLLGGGIVSQMEPLLERSEWLSHLQYFAAAEHPSAHNAMVALEMMAGVEGRERLRDLYHARSARDPRVRYHLSVLATQFGWQ